MKSSAKKVPHSHQSPPESVADKKQPKQANVTRIGTRLEVDSLRNKIVDLVAQKPEKAAIILSDWIKK